MSVTTKKMTKTEKPEEGQKLKEGFTLIELSIVLVIIGLIIGGILTGQDLIKAAEQRATLAQIEKYNTAVNTFRNKFGGIPGDLLYASATAFGLVATGNASANGGDGNGLLQDGQTAASGNADNPVGEILLFWYELSQANLIDGSLGSDISTSNAAPGTGVTANDFPLAKLGRANYIIAGADDTNGYNTYALTGPGSSFTGGASGTAKFGAGTSNLTPIEAYNMDKKVDDGNPNTGTVQTRGATSASLLPTASVNQVLGTGNVATNTATSAASYCIVASTSTATSATYNVTVSSSNNSGTTQACSLRFRFN